MCGETVKSGGPNLLQYDVGVGVFVGWWYSQSDGELRAVLLDRNCSSSSHKYLLDLCQRRIFIQPLALRGVCGAQRVLDIGIADCEEFL